MLRRRGRAPGEPPPVEAVRDRQDCMVTKVWMKSGIFSPCVKLQFRWLHSFFWNVTPSIFREVVGRAGGSRWEYNGG